MSVKVDVGELMTCKVLDNGRMLRLDMKSSSGVPVSINMSFEQAESLMMTLPRLLRKALSSRTGSTDFRFVFPLGQWSVEQAAGYQCLIMTLKTEDGFDVSFGVPLDTSRSLAVALKQESMAADNRADEVSGDIRMGAISLN